MKPWTRALAALVSMLNLLLFKHAIKYLYKQEEEGGEEHEERPEGHPEPVDPAHPWSSFQTGMVAEPGQERGQAEASPRFCFFFAFSGAEVPNQGQTSPREGPPR